MTEHTKLPDIVEQLREAIREGAGQLAEDCIEEITRLRSRLEMDGVWQLIDGKMQRISVEPGSIPDGIECRDETIKLQDAEIARLRLRSPAPAEEAWTGACGYCPANFRTQWELDEHRRGHTEPTRTQATDGGGPPAEDEVVREIHEAGTSEGLREALKRIALITASGRTTELLAKMAQVNALARAALSNGRQ